MPDPVSTRKFVPADVDPADWPQLERLYRALLDRPIASADELRKWLADFSELTAAVSEFGSRRSIAKHCNTEDPEIEKAYLHFIENIRPKIQPLFFELQKKYLASPHHKELQGEGFAVLTREWRNDVELFRPENVPLQTELTKLSADYDKVGGAMVVEFRGRSYTLQQLARFLEEPDRQTRREAWELTATRRLQDRDRIDAIYDEQLRLRQKVAENAGMADFRAYAWKERSRFDYTFDDAYEFADAIERECMPVVRALNERRAVELKLNSLKPWDLSVDPKNRPPLRPFAADRCDDMVAKCKAIFGRLSPQLAEDFDLLKPQKNLDLDSRRGKRAGGYQTSLEESREPFIFMNAAGLQRDVETMLHEGGHAFHYLAAREEPLVFLRHAPIEFCEVASMSMELLGADHLDVFYGAPGKGNGDASGGGGDAVRAKRTHLEGIIRLLPWIATIDMFQHWIYTHPGHTRDQRTKAWLEVLGRFSDPAIDWSGHEAARESMWQRQLHLFHHPFYYIEYGIAQLGALQLWQNYRRDPRTALESYRSALRLGGTRPLPKLFEAAGVKFDFSEKTLRPLMQEVGRVMEEMPS